MSRNTSTGRAKYYSVKLDVPALGFFKNTPVYFYVPDARTLVLESRAQHQEPDRRQATSAKPLDWDKVERGTTAFALPDPKTRLAKKMSRRPTTRTRRRTKVTAALAAVFAKADSAVMGVDIAKTCRATLSVSTTSLEDLKAVRTGSLALIPLAQDGLDRAEKAGTKLPAKPTLKHHSRDGVGPEDAIRDHNPGGLPGRARGLDRGRREGVKRGQPDVDAAGERRVERVERLQVRRVVPWWMLTSGPARRRAGDDLGPVVLEGGPLAYAM